jgi:hypothetical protein
MITHTLLEECVSAPLSETFKVTRGMVRELAVEFAIADGRKPHEANKSDWENAKLEMKGIPRVFTVNQA